MGLVLLDLGRGAPSGRRTATANISPCNPIASRGVHPGAAARSAASRGFSRHSWACAPHSVCLWAPGLQSSLGLTEAQGCHSGKLLGEPATPAPDSLEVTPAVPSLTLAPSPAPSWLCPRGSRLSGPSPAGHRMGALVGSPPIHALWPSGPLWVRSLPVGHFARRICLQSLLRPLFTLTPSQEGPSSRANGSCLEGYWAASRQLCPALPRGAGMSCFCPEGTSALQGGLEPLFFVLLGPEPKEAFLVQSGLSRSCIKPLLCASPVLNPELSQEQGGE